MCCNGSDVVWNFVFTFLHIFRKNYIAGHSPPFFTPKNVLPVPLSRYTQFKFQAELGPRQHCRENVTMFSVHTIVVYCYYCRLLTIPCGYSTMRLQDYSYFFGSLMLNFFVVLSLSRSLNNCDVPSFDTESKHFFSCLCHQSSCALSRCCRHAKKRSLAQLWETPPFVCRFSFSI